MNRDTEAPTSFVTRLRQSSPHRRWFVLGVIGLGIINGGIDNSAVNLAMPRLAEAFGVQADVILWLAAGFMVVAVGLALTWGSLGDSIGRRRVYLTGFLFFTLGLGVLAVSQNVAQLIGGRVVQAIGQSMLVTNGFAIAIVAFSERDRGMVIGLVGAFVGIGLSLGPIFGGTVLQLLDWRALFYIRLPLGLLIMGLAWLVIPSDRHTGESRPFDYVGAVTLFIALTSLLLVINRVPRMGLLSPFILGFGAAALVSGVLFVLVELRVSMPVVNFALFRSRLLSVSLSVHFLHFLALIFLVFLLPFYLLQARGLPETQVGLLLAIPQVVRLVVAPAAGVFTDRLGSRTVATVGVALAALGLALLARLDMASSIGEIVLALALMGVGAAIFDPANESAVLRSVPQGRLASATAMTTTARQVGFSVGTAIAGTAYAARLRLHEVALLDAGTRGAQEAVALAYQEVILAAVAITAVATLLSLLRGPDRRATVPAVPGEMETGP